MSPGDWAHMPWPARRALTARLRRRQETRSIVEMARAMEAAMVTDPDVAAHLAALDHYTSKPRKRTA